jgi:CSLREA domain-containing protein
LSHALGWKNAHAASIRRAARRRIVKPLERFALAIPLVLAAFVLVSPADAATTINVTTTVDELINDGNCSLREAVQAANTNAHVDAWPAGSAAATDIIVLPAGDYPLNTHLDIAGEVRLQGAGAARTLLDHAGGSGDRVLQIGTGATVTLADVTIQNGFSFHEDGGGIVNDGTLVVIRSTIRDNRTETGFFSASAVESSTMGG